MYSNGCGKNNPYRNAHTHTSIISEILTTSYVGMLLQFDINQFILTITSYACNVKQLCSFCLWHLEQLIMENKY
jgi:hypothetical protein